MSSLIPGSYSEMSFLDSWILERDTLRPNWFSSRTDIWTDSWSACYCIPRSTGAAPRRMPMPARSAWPSERRRQQGQPRERQRQQGLVRVHEDPVSSEAPPATSSSPCSDLSLACVAVACCSCVCSWWGDARDKGCTLAVERALWEEGTSEPD